MGAKIDDDIFDFSTAVTACNESDKCKCFFDNYGEGRYVLTMSDPWPSTSGSNAWVSTAYSKT